MTLRIRVVFARVALLSVAAMISLFPRAAAGQDPAVFTSVLDFDGQEFTHVTFDPGDEHSASGILSKYSSLAAFTIEGGNAGVRHYTAYFTDFFGDDGTEGGAVTGEYRIDWGYFGNSLVTVTFVEPVDAVGAFFGGVVPGSAGAALAVALTDGRTVIARVVDHLSGVMDGAGVCVAMNGFLGIDSNGGPGIVQAQFSNAHDAASLDSLLFGTAFGGSTGPGPTGFARVPYVEACGQSPIPLPEPSGTTVTDHDGDGLLDSTEVDMAMGSGCPSPLDADSDNDGLTDGVEVAAGTNPCSTDTDGDGVPDGTDPLPLQSGVTCGFLESMMRSVAVEIDALDLPLFSGAGANADSGRRNSLATRVQNAANSLCDGQGQSALANLNGVLEKVDGDEPPPDWMFDSPEKTALKQSIELLISLTPP